MSVKTTWLDRAIGWISPQHQLRRHRARIALGIYSQFYEAGDISRRTQGWKRPSGDPNAISGLSLARLRDAARHLVRNNGHAWSAVRTIHDDVVGWGILSTQKHEAWQRWTETIDIDADGRCDFPGVQQQVIRTVMESGECLVRRRWRRLSDGYALPVQLQLLEPDFIDSSRNAALPTGGKITRGIEFDPLGRRSAYWLFREHPGATFPNVPGVRSVRVPASEILHIYRPDRPGQVRGVSWFAPALIRFNDFDELADATLMKQKIAACLAAITSDTDGSGALLGSENPDKPEQDLLEPGMILNLPPGRSVTTVEPPTVREYADFARVTLQEIAAGLGVTPEDLTGDYSRMNFSSARMSRLRHWMRVEGWRWRMLAPQFLNPVWRWAMEAAAIAGLPVIESTGWTAPPLPMIEPDKEGLAIVRNIRGGIMTPSEALRERGYVPEDFWNEYENDFADLARRGLITDADAKQMTQAGQRQMTSSGNQPTSSNPSENSLQLELENGSEHHPLNGTPA